MADEPFPVVALACPAGGLEALLAVLAPLPADLPAAVVALGPCRPDHPGELVAVLERRCSLAVSEAVDRQPLRPGAVAVVPPGRHALAGTDGTLRLIASRGAPPHRPCADLLLATLAVTLGPRVVAVVLSADDGATGATAVHALGGAVVAADEASSREFGIPAAVFGRDAVDHVLPVGLVAGLLVSLTRGPGSGRDGEVDGDRAAWARRRAPAVASAHRT